MSRYIDADIAKTIYLSKSAGEQLDRVPTADVQEVKHASYTKNECCTNCGSARATDNRYVPIPKNEIIFCYHCGAKMDGDKK